MPYSAEQTARLQLAVDVLPSAIFAEDMVDITNRLAKSLTPTNPSWITSDLAAALSGLTYTGQRLKDEGGDGPSAAHSGISGLYEKGSDGYTDFLRAYAGAYRAWDDVMQAKATGKNWATDLISGTKSFFKDVGSGVGGLARGALGDLFKGLWPVFALIGAILLVIVIIAVVTKGKISIR